MALFKTKDRFCQYQRIATGANERKPDNDIGVDETQLDASSARFIRSKIEESARLHAIKLLCLNFVLFSTLFVALFFAELVPRQPKNALLKATSFYCKMRSGPFWM